MGGEEQGLLWAQIDREALRVQDRKCLNLGRGWDGDATRLMDSRHHEASVRIARSWADLPRPYATPGLARTIRFQLARHQNSPRSIEDWRRKSAHARPKRIVLITKSSCRPASDAGNEPVYRRVLVGICGQTIRRAKRNDQISHRIPLVAPKPGNAKRFLPEVLT